MLQQRNSKKEELIIKQLIENDKSLQLQHDLFIAEMNFKQELINARRNKNLTQKEVSELSGLSQQAISRLEKGKGGTIETILKYLASIGYSLTIEE